MPTAGSPKLKAYDTNFGWGKPRKSEGVQVDSSGVVSLCESGDGSGRIEVELAMERRKMAVFRRLFDDFLSQI
ncbi:Coumaroyl-CoA:anthocyanidin 3-O-glucoside-6''-O-coumaroyltransferase 2 [Linum perenne]